MADPTFNPKLEASKIEDQKHEFINEMNDSSTKIKEIVEKFEDIDREAIAEMSQIADNDYYLENSTTSLLDDAKNNVTQYMVEMKELSESQTALLDNLKIWFENLGKNEDFLNKEQGKTTDNINKEEVIDFMSNYIHETEVKMEKAQEFHREVSHFWVKQLGQFKKEILQKNGEISHLKASIEKMESNNTKAKRTPKKEKEKKIQNKSDQELMTKIQSQIRTIEEQKNQIESLKNQLSNAQGQLGLSISSSLPSTEKYQLKMTEKENEIGRLKFESETQEQMLQHRIQQLEKLARRLQNEVILEQEKNQFSTNQLNNAKTQIQELENTVHKYVKLLELERNKPQITEPATQTIDTTNESLLEERMFEIAKCKEEIRELKLKHKEELFEQAETLRSKFALEKQRIFDSLDSGDDQALFKSIISEYENKLLEQRKSYEELKADLAMQWGGKISLLTHQYESRLKNQQALNEITLLKKKDEIQFEVAKVKLEFEDEFNNRVLQISQSFSNEMAKAELKTNRLAAQNEELKKEIKEYREILNIKNIEEFQDGNDEELKLDINNVYNPIENFLGKTDTVKTELKEQKDWELDQQKIYLTQYFQKINEDNQKELRNLLLSLQDSLSHYESERENPITVAEAITKISDAFLTLNSHCLNNEQNEKSKDANKEAKISLKEASERMDLLKNKIISLTSKNNELRKSNPNVNSSEFDSETEHLKKKVKYLESLQKGDTDEAIKILQKIEQDLRMEIDVKDTIIEQLKSHIFSFSYEDTIIFSKESLQTQIQSKDEKQNSLILPEKISSETKVDNSKIDTNSTKSRPKQDQIISNNNNEHKTALLEITFTDGNLEIPSEYFEEEEELIENSDNKNHTELNKELSTPPKDAQSTSNILQTTQQSISSTKTIVKTKIKTIIREVPKIEYKERPNNLLNKIISKSTAIEIFSKQPNLNFRKGQSMTLEFSSSSDDKNDMKTKVIDEKPAETVPIMNNESNTEDELKITDSAITSSLKQKHEKDSELSDLKRKLEETQINKNYPARRIITNPPQIHPELKTLNNIMSRSNDSPVPPPNSPNLIYSDATTLTDKELIEPQVYQPIKMKKKLLFYSSPLWHTNIPNHIVNVINHAFRVIRKEGSMVISDFKICNFKPHSPAIAADEETKERIEALQEQLRSFSSNNKEQKIRNDMLRQIPEVTVSFRDKAIAIRDRKIESLHARIGATEDQLKRIREQKLLDIRRKSRAFYSAQRGNISGPLVIDPPINNDSTQNLKLTSVSSVGVSKPEIKIIAENKPLVNGSSVPIANNKKIEVKFEKIETIPNQSDPMSEIIRILQCNKNFVTNQIEIGEQIINEFNGDINSYESYLKATKNWDENNEQFIKQMKHNQKLISDYHSQLDPLNARQNQVLLILKNMKKNEEKKEAELTDDEKLKLQQKILDDIQKKTENSESSVDPTLIIEQIQVTIKTIEEIGLAEFDEEESRILRTIQYKVKQFQEQLKNKEKIDTFELDSVLMETQSFISGMKVKIQSQSNEENQNLLNENEKLKKQIHKIKKARIAAEKELSLLKDKEISFETQINLLKSRLSEQQELAENSTSLYFAQMASLKSIVSQITHSNQNSDFINQIKNEILNLQTISETSVHEKEIYKQKANEAEDRLIQADIEKATAIRELNELQAKYEKLDAIIKKAYEEKMFYESDIKKIKTEKAIEIEAKMKLKTQISQLVEDNEKINETLKKKREKVKLLKKQLESLRSENDELTIQVTFGLGRRRDIPKTAKATQTMFVRVKKHNNENDNSNNSRQKVNQSTKAKPENEEKQTNNVVFNFNQISSDRNINKNVNENESNQNERITSEEEEKSIDENEPIQFDLPESNMIQTKSSYENLNIQNPLSQSDSSISSSQLEWQEEIDQDIYGDSILQSERATKQSFESIEKGEKAVSIVHSPLKLKKKKAALFQQPQKTYMSPKSNKIRPKTVIHASKTQVNSEDLVIGSVTPGKRQLTGATQSPKPILPQKSQFIGTNIQILKPLEPLESAITTTNYEDRYASTQPASPKGHHISSLSMQKRTQNIQQQPFVTEAENGLSETVRITKYDVEGGNQNPPPKTPIIAPKYFDQQQVSNSQKPSHFQPKMAEVHKIMVRLREKLLTLQTKLDKKTEIISDLKKKLSDAVSENKQQRFAIIKAEDESKRANHRFDSLKIRYDIIFKELSSKEEDISDCKKEIYELRKIVAPAASSLSRLKNAQDEQLRILHEKERQRGMISIARTAITRTTSAEAQNHLCMLMSNTKRSIARLEAKRRMWKEVEKKQIMGALGALSLIDDKKSLFTLKRSITSIYDSPFRTKLTQKNRYSSVDLKINDDLNFLLFDAPLTPNNRTSFTPVFAKQLENINRMRPELSQDEKKQIIRGNVHPELAARIIATEKEREEQERMDNVIITPVKK